MLITTTDRVAVLRALAALAIPTLGACATVDASAPFGGVRSQVERRTGQVEWSRSQSPEPSVRAAIGRLLATPLTPQSAVQLALFNNRRLQVQFERLGIAQADLVEAGLLENPLLSLSLYYGAGTIIEASIVQDVLSLVSLPARKQLGAAQAERVAAEVAQQVLDLAAEVKTQYAVVVGDAQGLQLALQVQSSTEAGAELAQRQYAAGNLSQRERDLQQAFYAQSALEVAQAQAQLAADRERLNRLLGLWGAQTQWTIPERLPRVPAALPDLSNVEAAAIAQRLDLQAAKKGAQAALIALNLTRQFRYLSPLGLGVAFKREANGDKLVGPDVELGLPLFNQGQARIARAEADYRRAEDEVEALAVEIRSQARAARDRVVAAAQAVAHYERVLLPLQTQIADETLKFYNGMLVGTYDLLLAQQAQVQTARQYVAALKEFWQAWAELEHALGGPLASDSSQSPAPAHSNP
ncbi:MAG TPA: TolC family protein [Burkholderiales bacterium]|nr:TolC family protein [Burkholderiales bacterium]